MATAISMDGAAGAASDDDLSPAAPAAAAATPAATSIPTDDTSATTVSASSSTVVDESDDQVVSEGPSISRREQQTEWLAQFLHSPSSFHARALHRTIDERGLRESLGLRGVYWRLFLHILDRHDLKAWARQIREEREKYEQLAKSHRVFIRRIASEDGANSETTPAGQRSRSNSSLSAETDAPALDLRVHNPLSLSNPFAADNELSETIKHDLHRTHADRALFCSSRVQDLMFNVLFIWSKTESTEEKGRYRQGMNEILSPIVLVLMRESQSREGWDVEEDEAAVNVGAAAPEVDASPLAASIDETSAFSPPPVERGMSATGGEDALLPLLLDSRYVEHDVYALFVRVMHAMAPFFHKVDTAPRSSLAAAAKKRSAGLGSAMGPALGATEENPVDASPIVRKCNYIHHVLLSTIDPQLYTHLNRQDVAPTLYILRWYRVMFSREFVREHNKIHAYSRFAVSLIISLAGLLILSLDAVALCFSSVSLQHMEDTLLLWDVMFATTERSAVSAPSAASPPATASAATPESSFKRALAPKATETAGGQSGQGFLLAEYIVIAMLLYVRQALMHGDNSYCLRRLLRYPPVEDVRVLLARALHFHNGWKALTADPTLTRDSWNPTATDHDSVLAPRGAGAGSGVGSVPEGTTNPEAFQGPWQNISGDMGADAPLEGSPEPGRTGARQQQQQHLPQQSQGSRSTAQQQQQANKRGSQSGSSGKTLFSDSFASLKSFMKGTLQKASELPAHPPPSSERDRSGSQSKQPSPSPTNAGSNSKGGSAANRGPAPTTAGSRKAPTSSGVSHFLSSSASPPASSTSPNPSYAPIVTGPSAAQHDELILLRKQLASREKEVASLSASLWSLNQQLADARTIQTQMGNLLAQSIEEMEREYARSQGEHLANEDGDDEDTQESNNSGKNEKAEATKEATTVAAENSTVDPFASPDTEAPAVVATDVESASAVSSPAAAPAPSSSASAAAASKRRPFSEDVLLSGLAEFKHVRDVLVGRLTLPDIIDYLHTTTSTAASSSQSKKDEAAAEGHSSRKQILSDISSMHARQLESSRQSAKDSSAGGSSGGGGSSFPYNLAPPKPKAFTPLFETEVAPRDKVSELFALDESDAVPGVYPTVHKVTAPTAAAGPLQNVSALSTAAALGALNSSTSPLHANSSRIMDPLVSPPAAAAAAAVSSKPPSGAVVNFGPSAPSAAASSLLSGLLSSPSTSQSSLGGASSDPSVSGKSKSSASSSLFGSSPPSSPQFSASGARGRTGMFGDDDDDADSPFPSAASSQLAGSKKKATSSVFALEEEDDSILLPSASQFKEPPRSFKAAPKKPAAAATAAAAAPAPAAAVSPQTAKAAASSVAPASSAARVTSPLHSSPSPTAAAPLAASSSVASSTKSVAAEEDPLSWMGTGGK